MDNREGGVGLSEASRERRAVPYCTRVYYRHSIYHQCGSVGVIVEGRTKVETMNPSDRHIQKLYPDSRRGTCSLSRFRGGVEAVDVAMCVGVRSNAVDLSPHTHCSLSKVEDTTFCLVWFLRSLVLASARRRLNDWGNLSGRSVGYPLGLSRWGKPSCSPGPGNRDEHDASTPAK